MDAMKATDDLFGMVSADLSLILQGVCSLIGLGENRGNCQIGNKNKQGPRLAAYDLLGHRDRINCKMFSKVCFGQSLQGEGKFLWLSELGT